VPNGLRISRCEERVKNTTISRAEGGQPQAPVRRLAIDALWYDPLYPLLRNLPRVFVFGVLLLA
jgi:hypothetical protein